ncbi:AAA family ATPase [Phocaeicola massiliensis]|uniref:AAA family ATPase n=1 Tax=Phocaeicola massiliensis TaxID=204516 RepID=UPI0018AB75F9|nr:AAA family ATPase [Phocaeicola massiliensis]
MDRRSLYNQFLQQFPIESLGNMTLEEYSNLNKDNSFCYWLESKTYDLGSIWGGSAYKFGIFKFDKTPKQDNPKYAHDENYSWSSRLGNTSEEAFNNIRNAIIRIANHARNAEWDEIEKINDLWPVTTWKIAFLYSNEQLLPIYDKDGWLVPIANHFGLSDAKKHSRAELYNFLLEKKGNKDLYVFYDELLSIMEIEKTKAKTKIWLFAPGENACMWDECKESQTMRIGWDPIGDISEFKNREDLTKALQTTYNKDDASFKNDSLALWQFVHEVHKGDIVYAKKGINKIIGRGVVEGDYYYDETLSTYRHIRKVKWTHSGEWDYSIHKLVLKTLTDISKYPEFVKNLNQMVVEGENIVEQTQPIKTKQCWWLVASPDVWKFSDINVGDIMEYTLLNENGNKRRVYQNFLDAKAGDMVIGYASTPTLQVVALGQIAKDTDEKHLYFRKTEQLLNPIDYSIIKGYEELQGMECMAGGGRGTLFKVTEDEYQILMEIIRKENPSFDTNTIETYTDSKFLSEVYMSSSELQRLKSLLKNKKNIILQGAPGVGKTFTAKRLAYTLMGVKDKQRVEMIQFHQNYSYEDFILGYKPNANGGFELKHGVFYKFCKKALNTPDKDFFFIIDEINRGNLSKIFGELLMLIENNYRGKEIKLAYTDEPFTVPENLYIIGMMNTADRSLAMIDYALRRRFSFFEMNPGFLTDGFKNYMDTLSNERFNKIISGILEINEFICKDDSLGNGFCIGHSYFCNQKEFNLEWLENVIEYDIAPMLKEYWFDDVQKYESQITLLRNILNDNR